MFVSGKVYPISLHGSSPQRPRYQKYSAEDLKTAMAAIDNGMSLRKAANLYRISKSVLHRYKIRNLHQKSSLKGDSQYQVEDFAAPW